MSHPLSTRVPRLTKFSKLYPPRRSSSEYGTSKEAQEVATTPVGRPTTAPSLCRVYRRRPASKRLNVPIPPALRRLCLFSLSQAVHSVLHVSSDRTSSYLFAGASLALADLPIQATICIIRSISWSTYHKDLLLMYIQGTIPTHHPRRAQPQIALEGSRRCACRTIGDTMLMRSSSGMLRAGYATPEVLS